MIASPTSEDAHFTDRASSLGPAMRFVLKLARLRAGDPEPARKTRAPRALQAAAVSPLTRLWELAERYHPEQTWLAESWLRGGWSFAEIEERAPREPLADGFLEAARRAVPAGALAI